MHRQQDVADSVFVRYLLGEEGRGEQLVDVLLGDVDASVHHFALHAVQGELTPNLFPEGAVGNALLGERGDELVDVHAVLRGVVSYCPREGLVVQHHAAALGLL